MKTLIVLNQSYFNAPEDDFDFIVGVDGGCRWCIENNMKIDLAIGDFDSLEKDYCIQLPQHAMSIESHPSDKNHTDLELAISAILERKPTGITVLGVWGGRMDHSLGNLLCLAKQTQRIPITMPVGIQTGYLLKNNYRLVFEQANQQLISLMAIFSDCVGITTQGMKYSLLDATLKYGTGHGLSNVAIENPCEVTLQTGTLLVLTDSTANVKIINETEK